MSNCTKETATIVFSAEDIGVGKLDYRERGSNYVALIKLSFSLRSITYKVQLIAEKLL